MREEMREKERNRKIIWISILSAIGLLGLIVIGYQTGFLGWKFTCFLGVLIGGFIGLLVKPDEPFESGSVPIGSIVGLVIVGIGLIINANWETLESLWPWVSKAAFGGIVGSIIFGVLALISGAKEEGGCASVGCGGIIGIIIALISLWWSS